MPISRGGGERMGGRGSNSGLKNISIHALEWDCPKDRPIVKAVAFRDFTLLPRGIEGQAFGPSQTGSLLLEYIAQYTCYDMKSQHNCIPYWNSNQPCGNFEHPPRRQP